MELTTNNQLLPVWLRQTLRFFCDWDEANAWAIRSLIARCLARGSFTDKAVEAMSVNQWAAMAWCGTNNGKSSLKATAVLTTSSWSLRPQDVIGKTKSQSPLYGEDVARKEADWDSELRLDLTTALSARTRGQSQNGCFGCVMTTILASRQVGVKHGMIGAGTTKQDILLEGVCSPLTPKSQEVRARTHVSPSGLHPSLGGWPEATVCQKDRNWWCSERPILEESKRLERRMWYRRGTKQQVRDFKCAKGWPHEDQRVLCVNQYYCYYYYQQLSVHKTANSTLINIINYLYWHANRESAYKKQGRPKMECCELISVQQLLV